MNFEDPFYGYSLVLRSIIYVIVPAFTAFQFFRLRRGLHVFQLEGYKRGRFLRWCRANPKAARFLRAVGDKKPLVMTGRAWRTLITATLLNAIASLLKTDPAFSALEIAVTGSAPPLGGDANLLNIVFQNLLINAAQAMQGRGRIDVRCHAADGWHRVEVNDQGPGIPAEIRAELFRPFKTTKARGTGLGMATAKRLVELHGGRIDVVCPPSGGTQIAVHLPTTASAG